MKITCLGTGSWGFCLAVLLAKNGHEVISWTTNAELAERLNSTRVHPRFPDVKAPGQIYFTTSLSEALEEPEMLVESVTVAGIRPVFEAVKVKRKIHCPIVITSKGIEQESGLLVTDVIAETLGEETRELIGYLSGPSYAQEVIHGMPTSVVAAGYTPTVTQMICNAFGSDLFRVYPNSDVLGVGLGGALKNIIAIACGIADGLKFGSSARAALTTRGLHEIRKFAVARGCKEETINGLAGMGDLFLTCSSPMSRNYRFGQLLAEGMTVEEAREEIGMVVEGSFTCVAALALSHEMNISMPITELVEQIVYEGLSPKEAVKLLMQRRVKEEHL